VHGFSLSFQVENILEKKAEKQLVFWV